MIMRSGIRRFFKLIKMSEIYYSVRGNTGCGFCGSSLTYTFDSIRRTKGEAPTKAENFFGGDSLIVNFLFQAFL
jgi:hypothetical protein